MTQPFTGLVAYPITPLGDDGEPGLAALAQLVRNAVSAGVSGVTVLATSGAGVTFDRGERSAVVRTAVEAVLEVGTSGGAGESVRPVYAAVSGPSTRDVVHLARDAEQAGAGGLLLAPFSYLPLTDVEVRQLFTTIADATGLPMCFYNKPAQTQFDVSTETLAHLAANARVVAIKETMRREDVAGRAGRIRDAVGPDFSIGLSADVPLLEQLPDADAWHSGLAALLPADYLDVWRSLKAGAPQGASLERLKRIARTLEGMPHPIGALHAACNTIGVPTAEPRGPFAAATHQETWQLGTAINGQGQVR